MSEALRVALTCNNYPPEFLGGTERVVRAMARGLLAAGDGVIVICGSEKPHDGRDVVTEDDAGIPVFRLPIAAGETYGLNVLRPRLLDVMRGLLCEHRIDVLHVNHWSHLSDGQVRMANELGLRSVVTLHDMWTSCARFFRLPPDGNGIECPVDDARDECVRCVNLEFAESTEWVEERMQRRDGDIAAELTGAHRIYAPSIDCAQAARDHAGVSVSGLSIEVVPHGLLDAPVPERATPVDGPFRVGTFGNLNRQKGTLLLVEAMAGVPAELHLFGSVQDTFRAEADERARGLDVTVHWHGAYDATTDHPASRLDVAVFPSLCRESYGLVVDEALHHGIPVIVTEIGALPERVRAGGGLVVPPGDPHRLREAIGDVVGDAAGYDRLRASIPSSLPTMAAAVATYRAGYSSALRQRVDGS